jgi:glycine/D-amino acid oxidase-like deaminating enzyme
MTHPNGRLLIVGGGVFGLTAAVEASRRGWTVSLWDQGRIPHPDAASTDISKVVRLDYGADEAYTRMAEQALVGWRRWNHEWRRTVFHEVGFLAMTSDGMRHGGFESESWDFLAERGHRLERLDSGDLRERYAAWNADRYTEGYLNPAGGWAESSQVVRELRREAEGLGVEVVECVALEGTLEDARMPGGTVSLRSGSGQNWVGDRILVAAGSWTPTLLPELEPVMWATAQSVFHFRPDDGSPFSPDTFPVWSADIEATGWYGFPVNRDGLVKVANHGAGRRVSALDCRFMPEGEEARFRSFLRLAFPSLADAPVASSRVCLYCDTFDGAFWIDHHPERVGWMVASGGSGHAFKFAPIMGELIVDVLEGRPNAFADRFAWRPGGAEASGEGARSSHGVDG